MCLRRLGILLLLFGTFSTGVSGQEEQNLTVLTAQEQGLLAKAPQTNDRFQIYLRAADARLQGMIAAFRAEDTDQMQMWIRHYREILQLCSDEMDKRPPIKPRQARPHEIQLRRYGNGIEELFSRADPPEQEPLRRASELTQQLRNRFLKIYFGNSNIQDTYRP